MNNRPYDVMLYGASGFVGCQTVRYFASHAGVAAAGLRWGLAGRDRGRLERARFDAGGAAAGAAIVVAAADDARALGDLAASTAVVLNTAGPFARYGSELVAACVRHGTHYVDITGETPWVRELIDRHHLKAAENSTRIVPFCGFDSVPSDLGVWLMVQTMQQRHGAPCIDVKAAFSLRGGLNGGTVASAFGLLGGEGAQSFADPFLLNPTGIERADRSSHADPVGPQHDDDFGAWMAPFFMGPVNTRVVRRSAALLGYGDGFRYREFLRAGSGLFGGAAAVALSAGTGMGQLAMAAPPLRRLAERLAPKPGQGPSDSAMQAGWFRCELIARSAAGHRLRGRVADSGDPGNRATTKMVCEAALSLALDRERLPGGPLFGGVLTPASALGPVLVDRLRAAGMTLAVDGG